MSSEIINIDLASVLRQKLGSRARYVPSFLVKAMARLIHQDDLNAMLRYCYPRRGAAFCEGVLENLDVKLEVRGAENMPADARFILVSNHPLGGLDGICMIAWLSRLYGPEVHFVVNDLLMAIEPLREVFIPINKHGRQSREYARALDDALAGNAPVVYSPAGLVSRLGKDGKVADLEWRKNVVAKAIATERPVVPVYFVGLNSPSFYRWARRRTRLGLKFNFEMVLLPREVFRARGATFTLTVGKPVPWQELAAMHNAAQSTQMLRNAVYSLAGE